MAIDPKKQLPGGAETFNEEFFDALVRHQIGLMRVSGGISNELIDLLNATEGDISGQIRTKLARSKGLTSPADVNRLNSLLKSIRATRATAWDQIDERWLQEIIDVAQAEPSFVDSLLKASVPAVLQTALPTPSALQSIALSTPFEGRTLRQWASKMEADDLARIESEIKIGLVQGQSSQAIARRVVGTVRVNGRDGVTQITRNNAKTITRTAITAISNQAKRQYYDENKGLFVGEMYVATLDGRTTAICRSLDGKSFPVGEGPIPPLHFNCRSLRVATVDGELVGDRPARPFAQKQLLREFSRTNGIRPAPTTRDGLPFGTKGRFDDFSRIRMRELTGQVPAKVSYQVWLGRQSAEFQNDVLGPTRGALFRRGDLTLDSFVSRSGDELTLAQLADRQTQAFVKAGLDPAEF